MKKLKLPSAVTCLLAFTASAFGAAPHRPAHTARVLNTALAQVERVLAAHIYGMYGVATWVPCFPDHLRLSETDRVPKPWWHMPNYGGIRRAGAIFHRALADLRKVETSGVRFNRRAAARFLAYYAWFEAAYAYRSKTFPYARMRKLVLAAYQMDKHDSTALWMRGMLCYWRHYKTLRFMHTNVLNIMPSVRPLYGHAALKYINLAVKADPHNYEAWCMRLLVESAMVTYHNRMANDPHDAVAEKAVVAARKYMVPFFFDFPASNPGGTDVHGKK